MEKKVKILAALVLSASVLFAGCGGSKDGGAKATDKNTINISLHQDPPKLDPRISSAFVERHVFQSLFDKLVDLDGKGNIAPMLAEKEARMTVDNDKRKSLYKEIMALALEDSPYCNSI